MKRREFIAALGGLALAWPLAARAQQPARIHRIGVLLPFTEDDAQIRERVKAFEQSLRGFAWTDGGNIRIAYRYSGDDPQRLRNDAAELVGLNPEVILAATTLALLPLRQATRTIPIIFVGLYDPVGSGIVANLTRPDGNVTGFTLGENALAGKMLEQLKEIAPTIDHATIIMNPDQFPQVAMWHDLEAIGPALKLPLIAVPVREVGEIEPAIQTAAREPNGGLVVVPGPVVLVHRARLTELASSYRVPAVYGLREFAISGGLMSYGANPTDLYRSAAGYVDRILKGATPAELPVQNPTKFELIINRKTATVMGLAIPPSILLRADEVIE